MPIDNIVIVPHEHNYNKTINPFKKTFDSHPVQIGIGKEYWWGINTKYSSSLNFGSFFKNESVVFKADGPVEDQWNTFGFFPIPVDECRLIINLQNIGNYV